jgi:hypothetical protein
MTTLLGRLLISLALIVTGEAMRRASHVEMSLSAAEAALATLDIDEADRQYGTVEENLTLAGQLPFIGAQLLSDVRQDRALVSYWRGDYAGVPSDEADLAKDSVSADLVHIAGNAAYRRVKGQHTGQEGAQDLDGVLRMYGLLLKKNPGHLDGAYNYEYIVRLRNVLSRQKPGQSVKGGDPNNNDTAPPSIHGDKGQPPTDMPPEQFNVIVPLKPEERGELMRAGTSGPVRRKG